MERRQVREIGEKIAKLCQPLAEDLGVTIKYDGGSFGVDATIKLRVCEITTDGKIVSQETSDFERFAAMHDLKPNDLGKKFVAWDGSTYEIVGLKVRSRKNPIVCKRLRDDKYFKFPSTAVKNGLTKNGKQLV